MPQVVGAQLQLVALFRLELRRLHHARVVDHRVDPRAHVAEFRGRTLDRVQVGQVKAHLLGLEWLRAPGMLVAVIGTAVSFYLGFKGSAAYGRRKGWEHDMDLNNEYRKLTRGATPPLAPGGVGCSF